MGIWAADSLTGGVVGSLDNIPTSELTDEDKAVVVTDKGVYYYIYKTSSGLNENSPKIIIPDDAIGDEAWESVDSPIQLNRYNITLNWSIPDGFHGMSVGPLDIDADITINENSVWEVL